MQLLFVGSCIFRVYFNQDASIKTVARCAGRRRRRRRRLGFCGCGGGRGCCGGSSIVVLFTLSCDKAISLKNSPALRSMYALKSTSVRTLRLARAWLKCARVGGLPVGAEDVEGFDVGDQALGDLRAGGRVTACQPPQLLLLTFRHGGSAAQLTDV
jgi:hypothetical protein